MRLILGTLAASAFALIAVFFSLLRSDIPASQIDAVYRTTHSRFVMVDGTRVHYVDQGQGPVVVLLHGMGASSHTWRPWADRLSKAHRVIAPDLPGHGLTGPDAKERYSWPEMAAFLNSFVDALGVDTFALGGNSMGGAVAWHYALDHQDRVSHLILVDSIGLPRDEPTPLIFAAQTWPVIGDLMARIGSETMTRLALESAYGDSSRVTPQLVRRYYELGLREGNRAAAKAIISRPMDVGRSKRLNELKMPVMILWGGKDTWIVPKYGEAFQKAIPGSKLLVFSGLGHAPMEEDPEATAPAVVEFLRR